MRLSWWEGAFLTLEKSPAYSISLLYVVARLPSSDGNRKLTQQDGWKSQDGRMTKKCRARPGMHSLAPHFFVILPS